MTHAGRFHEAAVYLRKARGRMLESGCLYRLDVLLVYEAEVAMHLKSADVAARILDMAACASANDGVKSDIRALEGNLRSGDCGDSVLESIKV